MKKIKSVEDKFQKKEILRASVDWDYDWYEKAKEENRKDEQIAHKKEEERIEKLKCPLCTSPDKKRIIKSENNGILGPSYHSWAIDEYFVCKKCGTMFKDVTKLDKE